MGGADGTSAPGDLYHSARLATGYAVARPPLHPLVMDRIARHSTIAGHTITRALDVGCGAGLSTAALAPLARLVVGIDPALAMLAHGGSLAPAAHFVVGRAEHLPLAARSFELVTAAGALNYTDKPRALAAIARVLAADGVLAIYDFSTGRRCRATAALDTWFDEFERRYPYPGGYAMDVQALDYCSAGLRLVAYEPFEIPLPLTLDAYVAYVLTEANVERAAASGVSPSEIAAWCRRSLRPVFGSRALDISFDGYVAYAVVTGDRSGADVAT